MYRGLDFLQINSVSTINYLFEMQMFKNVLTFLRHNLVPTYFFSLPWSLHCLRRHFHAKRFKFPGICQPSVTGWESTLRDVL